MKDLLQVYLGGRVRNCSVRALFRLCRRNFATALAQRPVWPPSHRAVPCRICQAVAPCSAFIFTRHAGSSLFPTSCPGSSSALQRKDLPRRQQLFLSAPLPYHQIRISQPSSSSRPSHFPPRFCSRKRTCFFTTTIIVSHSVNCRPSLHHELCPTKPLPQRLLVSPCVESENKKED